MSTDPLIVEITRGPVGSDLSRAAAESCHRVHLAVTDRDGTVLMSAGDVNRAVFPRSAIKFLQAIPLVESGAADAFGLSDAQLALACASHNGEPFHVAAVDAWLAQLGLTPADLVCAGHPSIHLPSALDQARTGIVPGNCANNCSGKHAGLLTLARHLNAGVSGYADFTHPVQQRLIGVLEMMCGLDLMDAPWGTDGCGIPCLQMPLGNLALGMARFADPADLPEARADAIRRLHSAITAHPHNVAGTGRFDTDVMSVIGKTALMKVGAEGVYAAALPEDGVGVAIKAEDGNARASEFVMARLLERLELLAPDQLPVRSDPQITSWAGEVVGHIRFSGTDARWPF